MHRTIQLELKKKQIETANETKNQSKAENRMNCRTKRKLNMFLGISYEYGDKRKKNLWRWMLWFDDHAT